MATDYGFIFKLAVLVFACLGTSASPSGEVLNVREGKGFEITCWVIFSKDSDSREPVKFLKDGQLVQPSYRVSNRGGVLTVLRARMSDTGAYSCKAGDDVEEVGTIIVQPDTFDPEALGITVAIVAGIIALAMLIVGAIVYKQRCTSETSASPTGKVLNVVEGQGLEVTCMVIVFYGSPDAVTFLKDGRTVWPTNRIRITGGKLEVEPVEMSDAGVYSCMAGDEVKEVGRVVVLPSNAMGITIAVLGGCIALVALIVGALYCKKRCTS